MNRIFLGSPRVVQLPANHNLIGTCGECGGPIISPMLCSGTAMPDKWCMDCNRRPKDIVTPAFGPVLEMTPNNKLQPPKVGC